MQADLATITERVRRPRSAEVVRYRFFFSMTLEEVAKQTECSVATVHRELAYARAFLTRSGITIAAEVPRPLVRQPSVAPSETVPRRGPEAVLALSPAAARSQWVCRTTADQSVNRPELHGEGCGTGLGPVPIN